MYVRMHRLMCVGMYVFKYLNILLDDYLSMYRCIRYQVRRTVHSGPSSSYAYGRLEVLLAKFNLHCLLNNSRELDAQKSVPHRGKFARKLYTHPHILVRMHTYLRTYVRAYTYGRSI
jgi:hypothetical protein